MAVKIGDLLLQEGLVTSAQLDEALKYQVIFGGKIGTNLIEMGLVEEEDVARVLGKKLGVPTLSPDEIMNVSPAVLQAVPRELVEQYGVVPIRLEGRRLTLLMPDPTNLKVVDEIGFRTGLIVKPVVAAEVRIVLALEQHYQIERDRRYIHATKKVVSKRRDKAPRAAIEPSPVAPAPVAPTPAAPAASVPSAPMSVPPPQAAAPPPVTSPAPAPAAVPVAAPPSYAARVEEAFDEALEEVEALEEIADAETVSDNLADPRDRDDILDTLAAFLSHEFAGSAVFLVRGAMALGWKATSEHRPVPGFSAVEIPLDETSILKTVTETRAFYLGPVPRAPFNSMLLQELGGRVPKTVLLVPLQMMGRVVGLLYVDDPRVDLGERLFELQKLTAKAAMAFEILVLKNKILSM